MRVPKKFLEFLTLEPLRDLCSDLDENRGGNKSEVISRLLKAGITFNDLHVDDLKDILRELNMPVGGNKSVLIDRLVSLQRRMTGNTTARTTTHVQPARVPRSNSTIAFEGAKLEELSVENLKDILRALDMPVSGNKTMLIERLLPLLDPKNTTSSKASNSAHAPHSRPSTIPVPRPAHPLSLPRWEPTLPFLAQPSFVDMLDPTVFTTPQPFQAQPSFVNVAAPAASTAPKVSSHETKSTSKSLFTRMTPAQYRREFAKFDPSAVTDDSEVCHIIASANGGADARENYIMLNGAFNRRIGKRGDHIMVYLVGIHKALSAVQASIDLNGYKGPSASDLYKNGEAFFRDSFGAQNRLDGIDDVGERIRKAKSIVEKSNFY